MLNNRGEFETYVKNCAPPIGWDGEPDVDFFRLIGLLWRESPKYGRLIERFLSERALKKSLLMLDKEFGNLMSVERRELIRRTLRLRQQLLKEACII